MVVPGSANLWCPWADSKTPPRGEIGDAGVDGPNPALRPEEPGTVVVPGSANLWCPRADSKTPPAGKLVTRVPTARIGRARHGLQGTDRALGERPRASRLPAGSRRSDTCATAPTVWANLSGVSGGTASSSQGRRAERWRLLKAIERSRSASGTGVSGGGRNATLGSVAREPQRERRHASRGPVHKRNPSAARPIATQ